MSAFFENFRKVTDVTQSFRSKIILFLIISMGGVGCEDIFVKDISEKPVNIVTPVNQIILKQEQVTFVWETMEGAEQYQVIVVSPSFNRIESYVCDSVLTDYKLTLHLDNGSYEWSVQALNSGYSSLKTYGQFQIQKP